MCRHIFSHPDYDRRLWHFTRSADPDVREGRRALAGSPHCMAYRRWGIAPRPEDVLHVVLTTFGIVRLSGFWGGICLLRVGVWGLGFGGVGWVLETPGAGAARGARVNDCGPEPSLRTAPASSSLPPAAAAFGFPWAHRLPAHPGPPPRQAPVSTLHRLWGGGCAWRFFAGRVGGGGSCGVAKKGRAGGRFWHLGGLRGRGRCARLGARRLEAGLSYFAVAGGFAAVAVLAASAISTTSAGSGFSAFFFFFFGSASIVPRHGGVPHRQR